MSSTQRDLIGGISTSVAVKAPVNYVTSENVSLTGLSAIETIGGTVTPAYGDRALVAAQDDPVENGIYDVPESGAWTRAKDFDGNRDVVQGTAILISDSTTVFRVTTPNPVEIGDSEITFEFEVGVLYPSGVNGDGQTSGNAAGINAALAAAKAKLPTGPLADQPAWQGIMYVDLRGLPYVIEAPVSLTSKGSVRLRNGMLIPDPAWPAGQYMVEIGDGAAPARDSRYAGLEHIFIECSQIALGLNVNQAQELHFNEVRVHGFRNPDDPITTRDHFPDGGDPRQEFGVRVQDAGGTVFRRCRFFQYFTNEDDASDPDLQTGVGICDQSPDVRWVECEAFYCKFPGVALGAGSHTYIDCHFFNGAVDQDTYTITGAANNGSGLIRLTLDSTDDFATNDAIVLPFLTGIASAGGSRAGTYKVTVIDGTHLDVQGTVFAGAYAGAGQTIMFWESESVNFYITDSAFGVRFGGICQFDNGKLVAEHGAEVFSIGHRFLNNSGKCRSSVELISGAGVSNFAGIYIRQSTHTIDAWRLTTSINGGSLGAPLKCLLDGMKENGGLVPTIGRRVIYDGGDTGPGEVYGGISAADDESGIDQVDFGTGRGHPSSGVMSEWISGNKVWAWNAAGLEPHVDSAVNLGASAKKILDIHIRRAVFGTYTWAARPAAADHAGKVIETSDVGVTGGFFISDGTYWRPLNGLLLLDAWNVDVTLTGTLVETVLRAYSMPIDLLGLRGRVMGDANYSVVNNTAANKIGRCRLNGLAGTIFTTQTVTANSAIVLTPRITNRTLANSQVGNGGNGGTGGVAALVTSAINTAGGTVDVAFTGELANATDSIAHSFGSLRLEH